MKVSDFNPVSLAFLGDSLYSLKVREYYLLQGYRNGKILQELSKNYVSASGQSKVYYRLLANNFFTATELELFKMGRNHIGHIPKNGERNTYMVATGLECLCGYWYLFDKGRIESFFCEVFKGGLKNE